MRQVACAMLVFAATPASAARISWNAPAACPDHVALQHAIEKRLDVPLDTISLLVDVTIEVAVDAFVARIDVHGSVEGSRIITSEDCRELTDAVALVIARLAAVASPEPPTRTIESPEPAVTATRWNGGLRVAGLVGTGTAPGVGVAAEIGGWVAWRSWAIVVSGSQWHERTVMLDDTMSGVGIRLRALSLRAGWRPDGLPVRSWLVAQWGAMRGEGVGLSDSRVGTARWSAAGVGAGWVFPITSRVAAIAAAEVAFVLDRARFTLDQGTELYRTPPLALYGSVTLEVGWR